ncbi:glycosyltransferase [Candidatus Kaiserbacteria bacterium]|nr:glycosyltransferase [Candidatus Kaiserbacteria bacterium]
MKVLMISGDPTLLDPKSRAFGRLELQRAQVERLDVFVWPQIHSLGTILKAVHGQHYDVVTAQDPFWRGHLAWHLARRMHARLNLQVHTDLAAQPWWRLVWAYVQLRRADSVRVVSERLKKEMASHIRAPIFVVPIYIDLAPFLGLAHTHNPRFEKTILWIGRFEAEKDPENALAVLKQVRAAGVDAGLILLGAGSEDARLRSEARRLTLPVEFPGWQNPLPYLQMADVVLSTSRFESYGASIIEALAAGVPVVAPNVGIAKEAGAIVVPRSNLAAAVLEVLRSGRRGKLLLSMPSAQEWAKRWRETLI